MNLSYLQSICLRFFVTEVESCLPQPAYESTYYELIQHNAHQQEDYCPLVSDEKAETQSLI